MSDFLIRLLRNPGDVRISRDELELLTECLCQGIPGATDAQIWHLETIRLYNLGMYQYADQRAGDRVYLETVRSLNRDRRDMARQHDTNQLFNKLYPPHQAPETPSRAFAQQSPGRGQSEDRGLESCPVPQTPASYLEITFDEERRLICRVG
jgi:hypothetical protein